MPTDLWGLLMQLGGAEFPTGPLSPPGPFLPDPDPAAPRGDVTAYLAALPAGTAMGAMPPYAAGMPAAWGGAAQARASFQPDAVLDPSQVNFWVGQHNPWNGWLQGQRGGCLPVNPPAFFDAIADAPGQYRWGSRNSYPYGPQWEAWYAEALARAAGR